MPRGKYTNHKGRNRKFTSPEELEEERKKEQKKGWRSANRDLPPSDSEESDENEGNESDDSEGDSEDDALKKSKGVEGMIEVENPNRIQKKVKKVETLNVAATGQPQLTRKEREELERQRAAQHYQKLHAEGKTDEARADLARLAIIKQQREEAAKKRELQIKEKEMAKQSKTAEIHKAIGKN